MKPKILFICKKRLSSYGISVGLSNSAKFAANYLNKHGIEAKVVNVVDNNCIDREVTTYNPTHVIIEALWVVPPKFEILLPLHKNRKWYVRIHSKAPFLAGEGIAMDWINGYREIHQKHKNFHISCNNSEFNDELNTIFPDLCSVYLPNVYCVEGEVEQHCHRHHHDVNIGCFGAVRPLKNQLIQAMAAIAFADENNLKLKFHMNGERIEHGENIIKNIRAMFDGTCHKLVEHPWMPHNEFLKLVAKMDLGLQVSLSESFNIVSSDFVHCNIPLIVSPDISWMPCIFQANPNSMKSIVSKLNFAYYTKDLYTHKAASVALWWYNQKAGFVWQDVLGLY